MLCIRPFRQPLFVTLLILEIAICCIASDKLDPPSANEQADAKRTVAEIYKSDYDAAKTPTARVALAKKLIEVGNDTKDDPAAQFVLWRIAKDIAVRAADYDLAATAINKLDDRFTIDALSMKVEALESVVAAPEAVPNYQKLLPVADALLTEAISSERFDLADRACTKAVDFANKIGEANLIGHASSRQKELMAIEAAFKEIAQSLRVLKTQPLDPAANLVMGKFRCFAKNDWNKGLPLLARSQDETLMPIAKKDLAAPADATAQVALADEWWNLAETAKDDTKTALRERSAYWYQKAIPMLSGLTKEKAERRAASVSLATPPITSVPDSSHDIKNGSTVPTKPKSPATLATLVDHEAQKCHSAKDALLVYKLFLADSSVPDEAKQRVQKQIAALEEPAAKDDVRLGPKWVSRDEARTAQQQAESLVGEALNLLNANNAKEAKVALEKASRTDPNATRPDFLLGILYALVGRDYTEARTHLRECVRREPQDVCTLNNLAVVELMANESQNALNYLRQAKEIDPTVPELAHNVRKVLTECGAKNLKLSSDVESSFSELYGELLKSGASEEKAPKGWLYIPPVAANIDSSAEQEPDDNSPDEPPKSSPAPKSGGGRGTKPAKPKNQQKTPDASAPIILAGGTGFVVYPHYILTNQHVIEGFRNIFVSNPNDPASKKQLQAKVVAQSSNPDLAILRCDELDAPPIGVNPRLPGRGTDIMVLGYPEFFHIGTGLKTTRGSIVGLPTDETEGMCLYDAATNHGNSGGPICDKTGQVVAVVRVIFNLTEMLNGGIPSAQVTPFLSEHIPGFRPAENSGEALDWPDVDALVSKSTILILCKADREAHFTVPDEGEILFQGSSNSSTAKTTKISHKTVKAQPTYIEDDCCITCRGTGMIHCPDCVNGTISHSEKVTTYSANGLEINSSKVFHEPCPRCHGTGEIPCPVCGGTGHERGS